MPNTNFPGAIDTPTNPIASNGLNSPSHAGQHGFENDAIVAIETLLGITGSAVNGTVQFVLSGITGSDKAVGVAAIQTLTNKTLTSPVINLGSDATGDLYYRNASGLFTRLAIGTALQILAVSGGGIPAWVPNPAAAVGSQTVAGVFQGATAAQINAGTAAGSTGANLVVTPDQLALAAYAKAKFGGTGADGALTVLSGTTTINLGGLSLVEKNYTSINVAAGATLNFSNPNANGTIITLKSQGAVVIAGTVDASGMGAAGGALSTNGNAISAFFVVDGLSTHNGNFAAGGGTGGTIYGSPGYYTTNAAQLSRKSIFITPGSGGAGGQTQNTTGGTGGNGGGAVYIECAGALNFTGTINASGLAGGSGGASTANNFSGSGGGGGAAGMVVVLYNSLTANSGTITNNGGIGGSGGVGSGGPGSATIGGGGGAGCYGGAGGAGTVNNVPGNAGAGLGAGGGGSGGYNSNGGNQSGGAAGGNIGGVVALNTVFG